MKTLNFILSLELTDKETGELLVYNVTSCEGSEQTIVHATKGLVQELAHSFEIAAGQAFLAKQKEKAP